MGAVAVAVIVRREREIVETYRDAGATSAEHARTPDELGVPTRVAFDRLVERAVLREVGGGRYFLDEPSWLAMRRMRRRFATVIMVSMAIAALVVAVGGIAAYVIGSSK
jgi:hypothetical protein